MRRNCLLVLVIISNFLFTVQVMAQVEIQPPVRGSSRWGKDDERGAANLITAQKILEAVQLIRTGKSYQLGRIYEEGMPLPFSRQFKVQTSEAREPRGKNEFVALEELLTSHIGQVGTQFDGLGHIGINGIFYNGYDQSEFRKPNGLEKLGVENVGIFLTRGILLDIAGLKGVQRLEKGYEITVGDLEEALKSQNLAIRPGDVVLMHTGWGSLWMVDNEEYNSGAPGVSVAGARFLAQKEISLIGSDAWTTDVRPDPDPELLYPAHQIFIVQNGIYILENLDTVELIRDRAFEFAFFFAPVRFKGFTGSPGNPVAIR